ncbi:Pectinesterase [Heracleum sosnowskyi]|uniref:pectinesterase n=1 Tax=Heracleum sosnowskyi TaxID=360622 RepID=A0AAD8IKN8_9APIA|nr:Pectinesterase [Heracleum sosnowskyi]
MFSSSDNSKPIYGRTLCLLIALTFISSFDLVRCNWFSPKQTGIVDAPLLTMQIASNKTIKVAQEGGEFSSLQAAIDSVPGGNSEWVTIHVWKGVYREKVTVPENKPFIFIRGNGKGRTIVTWSQSSANNTESATFKVNAQNVVVFGLSIKNEAPTGVPFSSHNQSVAVLAGADKVAFYHCAFHSTHNTLFDYKGRHYYDNCYIQGSIDVVFGEAKSIFHTCEIFVIEDKSAELRGSITAHSRESANENSGFVFQNGKVYGIGIVHLGRASGAFSRVVFANTYISHSVVPHAWSLWRHDDGSTKDLFHAEYKCHGPGATTDKRAEWSKQLTDKEVEPFLSIDYINGKDWLPAWQPAAVAAPSADSPACVTNADSHACVTGADYTASQK